MRFKSKLANKAMFMLFALFGYTIVQAQTSWNTETFEDETRTLNIQGSVVNQYGIWVDGGSNAYTKSNDYVWRGDYSFAITGDEDDEKPAYGSVYTKNLDLTSSSSVSISFRYFAKSKSALDSFFGSQEFYLQVSNDGGETFTTVKTYRVDDNFTYIIDPYDYCPSYDIFGVCDAIIDQFKSDFWSSDEVEIPSSITYTDQMVIRLKSNFDVPETIGQVEVYLDNIEISYTGGEPVVSNDLEPQNTYASSSTTLYNFESFETQENASWGIWNDGGGDAYQSPSYPSPTTSELEILEEMLENGDDKSDIEDQYDSYTSGEYSLAIRDYYDYTWLEDEDDEYSGEKATYSSIYTDNLDFTSYEELELHFSFAAVGLEYEAEPSIEKNGAADDTADGFALYISRDAGISYTLIKRWVAGVDFSNEVRYPDVTVSIHNSDFDEWTGTEYDFDGFTTTTILKFTSESDDDTDIVYLDNVFIYTAGDSGISFGDETYPDWESSDYVVVNSDGLSTDTYDLINQYFHPEDATEADYEIVDGIPGIIGAVEHSDCSHTGDYADLPQGITEEYDEDLGSYVFSFNMNLEADTDRCKDTDLYPYKNSGVMGGDGEEPDRQRVEIKTYSESPDYQLGYYGDTHIYAWKFKLAEDFAASDRFSHLHQLKSKNADTDEEGKPLITLTAGGEKTNQEEIDAGETDEEFKVTTAAQMRLRYSPAAESQINLAVVDLEPFLGNWVQCVEKITVGEWNGDGRYELLIQDAITGEEIMYFKSNTLRMYKTNADFIRAKWGLYRSLIEAEKLQDEQVKFADITVMQVDDPNASITDFLDNHSTLESRILLEDQAYFNEHACKNSTSSYCEGISNIQNPTLTKDVDVIVQAHRGEWGEVYQENTYDAFNSGSVFLMESDIMPYGVGNQTDPSADDFAQASGLACFHDFTLSRLTNGPAEDYIFDYSKSQLEALNLTKPRSDEVGDEKILFYEELIEWANDNDKLVCVDMKNLEPNTSLGVLETFTTDEYKKASLFKNMVLAIETASDINGVNCLDHIAIKTYESYEDIRTQLVETYGLDESLFNQVLWAPMIAKNSKFADGDSFSASALKSWIDAWLEYKDVVLYIETNFTSPLDETYEWYKMLETHTEFNSQTPMAYIESQGRRPGIFSEESVGAQGTVNRWGKWTIKNPDYDRRGDHLFVVSQPGMSRAVITTDRPDLWDQVNANVTGHLGDD